MNWNDLRILLALSRCQRFGPAARSLGVDDTTVARRLKALEGALSAPLFLRGPAGQLEPTAAGAAAIRQALRVEAAMQELEADLGQQRARLQGIVRLTSVPVLVNRVLVPGLAPLLAAHPDLTLELVAEARDLSLTRREADLALRLARPAVGGSAVKARRIGRLGYGVFAPAGGGEALPWIAYEDAMAHLPQARWLAQRAGLAPGPGGLRVADAETAIEAVAAGLGRAVLPLCLTRDARLTRLTLPDVPPPPSRDLWLLSHADLPNPAAIRAVADWLQGLDFGG